MSMDFYLDREGQRVLRELLAGIPGLVEDLSVTITRQSRVAPRNSMKLYRPKPESRVPFNIGAAEASDGLNTCLATWVRFTCENRQVPYTDRKDAISLARWLNRNVVGLALCEGSEEAHTDIAYHVHECRRRIDLPPDDEIDTIPRSKINEANRMIVTSGQVEKLAAKLGELGKNLTAQRVHSLNRGGYLRPISIDGETGTKLYRLGDVLHAHYTCVKRAKRSKAAS